MFFYGMFFDPAGQPREEHAGLQEGAASPRQTTVPDVPADEKSRRRLEFAKWLVEHGKVSEWPEEACVPSR